MERIVIKFRRHFESQTQSGGGSGGTLVPPSPRGIPPPSGAAAKKTLAVSVNDNNATTMTTATTSYVLEAPAPARLLAAANREGQLRIEPFLPSCSPPSSSPPSCLAIARRHISIHFAWLDAVGERP